MKRLLFSILLLPSLLIGQHSLSGEFSPAEDFTYAFLYHATPSGTEYVDKAQLDSEGKFQMTLDSIINPGIYKIVYAIPAEENYFDFIYNGKESVAFKFDLETGVEFTNSNENKLWTSYIKSMDMVNRTLSNFYIQKSTDKAAFMEIVNTMDNTQKAYEENSKGMLTESLVRANKPYIPNQYEDLSTYARNLKSNYLKHVDFSNTLLQSSDFLIERVLAYVFGMTTNTTDSVYKENVDSLMNNIGEGNLKIKTVLFEMIWQQFKQMGNTELTNYVADTYLLQLANQTNQEELIEEINIFKNTSVGNKAPNFDLQISKDGGTINTSLHDLYLTDKYLLIFWSSTCGHCMDELPKIKSYLASHPEVTVIAFGMEDEDSNWETVIKQFPDFIHVLGIGKWDNLTSDLYGVEATPSYFVLDKDKTIIKKPYDFDALKTFLK
ncbi:TlpA disulfide reductase family protein [Psychroserpens sp.]|uniref:TlpA family protein disulfide reductase n=1 Tax=Psychroserpens sp. TaxID=2020870 RepID=UPI001B0DDDC4|nr:TlpA disulfide reductase family protein [Psychroserpens sp.]MBO6607710.1 TlpA family protein disulfide reductase [Psychroserpens sp.]MBO6631094.1 TlpA family protein disulfide reductase [Psychroserpens sp.]MBO6654701.1 TlpA family protein disulfide reductase [Psychroserpens sp.]MBO6682875.1 TlpA family protein disulfide reductase [Psychroserpens sp.]MBO6751068.1 TlpA family protein disulfide reductase [Psychroserpens sp.]